MKYVIIVNGKPGSGKTAFETNCKIYMSDIECAWGHIISTINPIKDIYMQLGWNGKKTDEARKDLSTLKKMWIDTCNGPIKYIMDNIFKLSDDEDHVIFVDIREESEIIKLIEVLEPLSILDIKYHTVFINRPDIDGIEYGNKSDDNIGQNMSLYDIIIDNDSTYEEFKKKAYEFIHKLLNEEENK